MNFRSRTTTLNRNFETSVLDEFNNIVNDLKIERLLMMFSHLEGERENFSNDKKIKFFYN